MFNMFCVACEEQYAISIMGISQVGGQIFSVSRLLESETRIIVLIY